MIFAVCPQGSVFFGLTPKDSLTVIESQRLKKTSKIISSNLDPDVSGFGPRSAETIRNKIFHGSIGVCGGKLVNKTTSNLLHLVFHHSQEKCIIGLDTEAQQMDNWVTFAAPHHAGSDEMVFCDL